MRAKAFRGSMVDLKFGRLYVCEYLGIQKGERIWRCLCQCGNKVVHTTRVIRNTPNISCGCTRKESIIKAAQAAWKVTTKFNHPWKVRLKWLYRNMKNRCHKPGTKRWERYGGRGISVCDEWRNNPTAFYLWAVEHGYSPNLQLDRRDNDGNYTPENCRFVTQTENQNNTSRSRYLTIRGERRTVSQWSRAYGVDPSRVHSRLQKGWSVHRALTQPLS